MKPVDLSELASRLGNAPARKIAVAAAADAAVLSAVSQARSMGIAYPILCGSGEKIRALAEKHRIDIDGAEIVEAAGDVEAAAAAVSLVREKKAGVLMKGLLQTADLLRAVLNKETGLRTGGILSHVGVLSSEILPRTLMMTDGAMVMYPDLKTKAELIKNAVLVAKALGIETPNVAPIAAVELVNPDMPATVDAALLHTMNERGQIKGCVVDGPLAFDLAVSEEAARHKGVSSPVAGKADILLFHSIEACNSAMKAMTTLAGCLMGGVIVGAAAPIVLTSRSDSDASKLFSIAVAASM